MTLYAEVQAALEGLGHDVWPWPAPRDRELPYVTFQRKSSSQGYDLDGTRGLARIPVSLVVWSPSLEAAQELGRSLIDLLEPYTSSTVRKVMIGARELLFAPRTETHGFRVMAEFITTEE